MAIYSISVAGLALGAHSANTFSADFTNPAATVVQNTNWTAATTKYVYADTAANFLVRSVGGHDTRDHECTTWMRRGYVFLRVDANGKAIYFHHNGETTNGQLEIGIVTGLDQATYPSGTYYEFYDNADLVGTIAGYTKTNTDGDAWTFGVSGFDIYCEYNGVEVIRFQDYRHTASGGIGLKSDVAGPYGFRDITHETLADASLFSTPSTNTLDLRDFHVRALQTTGSISASSTSLTVASATGFEIGDFVIVEIGAEAGLGQRGTVGVGGVWPALHYANVAAMNADTGQAANTFAWVESTGATYWWTGPTPTGSNFITLVAFPANTWIGQGVGEGLDLGYYTNKSLPLSLQARITNIAGTTFTLDAAATATATNANVYLDNLLYSNYLTIAAAGSHVPITPEDVTIIWPAGSHAIGGRILATEHPGWIMQGEGQETTTIFTPKGVRCIGMNGQNSTGMTVQDLTLTGNLGLQKFGLNFNTTLAPHASTPLLSTGKINGVFDASQSGATLAQFADPITVLPGFYLPRGLVFAADDCVAQDCTINDVIHNAIESSAADNVWAYRVTVNITEEVQSYIQWQLEWTSSTGGGCEDCVINHAGMAAGFESFASSGTSFIRCRGVNALWATNGSGGWLLQDCVAIVQPDSQAPSNSINNPIININTNTGIGFAALGGTIDNISINASYIDGDNNIMAGIVIAATCPDVTITGGHYNGPDYLAPGLSPGPQGIRSQGTNTQVSGFSCCTQIEAGTPAFNRANIGITSGSVVNSRAAVIVAPYVYGNYPCNYPFATQRMGAFVSTY